MLSKYNHKLKRYSSILNGSVQRALRGESPKVLSDDFEIVDSLEILNDINRIKMLSINRVLDVLTEKFKGSEISDDDKEKDENGKVIQPPPFKAPTKEERVAIVRKIYRQEAIEKSGLISQDQKYNGGLTTHPCLVYTISLEHH